MSASTTRELVLVSGYYGFDNLGDEAILEELTGELKRLVPAHQVVVLSAQPEKTSRLFAVRAAERMKIRVLAALLRETRLFISGGGGLFQDTRSPGSVLYYFMQILLARAAGARIVIYAQGIGPLKRSISKWFTQKAFQMADAVTVRDLASFDQLAEWGVEGLQTADPVWSLEAKVLPEPIDEQLNSIRSGRLVALSLRRAHNFERRHLVVLVTGLLKALPPTAHVILLPLQADQDYELLEEFEKLWREHGREATLIDTTSLAYPSQWITLFGRCRLVVGMRLHALIMALKAGVAVTGIVYDPKVSHLLTEFEQPALILTKEPDAQAWEHTLVSAFNDAEKLAYKAMKKAEGAKKLACQNFDVLAKILSVQKDG